MELVIGAEDDVEVLRTLRSQARVMRRTASPTGAFTASKVELLLDRAIQDVSAKRALSATPLPSDPDQEELPLAAESVTRKEPRK